MDMLTRRNALALAVGSGIAIIAGTESEPARAQLVGPVSLADAIKAFNSDARNYDDGKTQPPLTEDEVIAAIRWEIATREYAGEPEPPKGGAAPRDPRQEGYLTNADYQTLGRIIEFRMLPAPGYLEVVPSYQPNDDIVVDVWSVRIKLPEQNGGSHALIIRDQKIRSRIIGPEERKVIDKWDKKVKKQGGIASFDRGPYSEERRRAVEKDRENQHL